MAFTFQEEVSNGVQTVYPVDFDFRSTDTVYVYTGEHKDYATQINYRWISGNTEIELLNLTEVPDGTKFYIRRVVKRDGLVHEFANKSIRGRLVDEENQHALYLMQEFIDGFISLEEARAVLSNLDMQDHQIKKLGDAVDEQDATNLRTVRTLIGVTKGANFVQEEVPTVGLAQGVRWYKPSANEEYIYYIDTKGDGLWTETTDVGDNSSATTVETADGSTIQTQVNIKDGITADEAVNLNGIASLAGDRIWLTDRQAWFKVVETLGLANNVFDTLLSSTNANYSVVLDGVPKDILLANGAGTLDIDDVLDHTIEKYETIYGAGSYVINRQHQVSSPTTFISTLNSRLSFKLADDVPDGNRCFDVVSDDVYFERVVVDGNYITRGTTTGATIHFDDSVKSGGVTKCKLYSAGFDTIGQAGASGLNLTNNIVHGGIDSGIDIVGGGKETVVTGNLVVATVDTLYPIAVDTFDVGSLPLVRGLTINDNMVLCGENNNQGLSIEGVRAVTATGNFIHVPTKGAGIKLFEQAQGCVVSSNAILLGNSVNVLTGVEVNNQNNLQNKKTNNVSSNTVYSMSSDRNVGYQIYQSSASIKGNLAVACRYGFRVNSNDVSKDVLLSENTAMLCDESYRLEGNHANISHVKMIHNESFNPVSVDLSCATGYSLHWVGDQLEALSTFGLNTIAVTGDYKRTSMPSVGSYKQGYMAYKKDVVEAGVSPNKYVLIGWVRMTDGASHVLGTDWLESRVLTGN